MLTYKYLNDSVSYESLRAAIKRITRKYLSFLKMEYNHDTHIFRHLDASFLHSIGKSFHDISIYLGHMDKSIVNLYIHEELSPNSINHN